MEPTSAAADRSTSTRKLALWWIVVLAVGVAALLTCDRSLHHEAVAFEERYHAKLREWMRMWRTSGFVLFWWVMALAIGLVERSARRRATPGAVQPSLAKLLFFASTLTGVLCELLKLLVRRERPGINDGDTVFRPWADDFFSARGLSMPSSESAIAWTIAYVLGRRFPAAWPVWCFFAAGCSFTRVLEGDHFPSDVFAGAMVGVACAWALWRRMGR